MQYTTAIVAIEAFPCKAKTPSELEVFAHLLTHFQGGKFQTRIKDVTQRIAQNLLPYKKQSLVTQRSIAERRTGTRKVQAPGGYAKGLCHLLS